MPSWLNAVLLEQPIYTAVETVFVFSQKNLSFQNLCEADDSFMIVYSEMGPQGTDTLPTALTNASTNRKSKHNFLKNLSKKLGERITNLTKQLNVFQKNQPQRSLRVSTSQKPAQKSESAQCL